MTDPAVTLPPPPPVPRGWRATLRQVVSLRDDADETAAVAAIRAGVDFRGGNFWALVLAIVVASVGLNVNSTAVIIGAMLISPLMGPLMGIGLGLGTDDLPLVRRVPRPNCALQCAEHLPKQRERGNGVKDCAGLRGSVPLPRTLPEAPMSSESVRSKQHWPPIRRR